MKVIINSFIPFSGFGYINLFGRIFTRNSKLKLSAQTENHEGIHTLQGKYLLWILFYLLYFIEWVIKIIPSMFCDRGKYSILRYAYRSISFEQQAFYNQDNLDYLRKANPYEWVKYIFKMYEDNRRYS